MLYVCPIMKMFLAFVCTMSRVYVSKIYLKIGVFHFNFSYSVLIKCNLEKYFSKYCSKKKVYLKQILYFEQRKHTVAEETCSSVLNRNFEPFIYKKLKQYCVSIKSADADIIISCYLSQNNNNMSICTTVFPHTKLFTRFLFQIFLL